MKETPLLSFILTRTICHRQSQYDMSEKESINFQKTLLFAFILNFEFPKIYGIEIFEMSVHPDHFLRLVYLL